MKLKRLLKKYNKMCKKASEIHREILYQYEQAYILNDKMVCKEIMNSLYGRCVTSMNEHKYVDTDSVIYKDFNKKSEV